MGKEDTELGRRVWAKKKLIETAMMSKDRIWIQGFLSLTEYADTKKNVEESEMRCIRPCNMNYGRGQT
jgi:hypothetical protein